MKYNVKDMVIKSFLSINYSHKSDFFREKLKLGNLFT